MFGYKNVIFNLTNSFIKKSNRIFYYLCQNFLLPGC